MATINITTSGDWDDLTAAAVDGDTISISNNALVEINQTPKFMPVTVIITDATVRFNGATGTAPISFVSTQTLQKFFDLRGVSYLESTEGYWTVGTTTGTANQVIDFSDYFFKTSVGGSRINDIAGRIPGLWVESGIEVGFTGATSIQAPEIGDWIYSFGSTGTCMGPIASVGTSPGDSSQGTIAIQYFIGTVPTNNMMDVRKIIDRGGPHYESIWQGTIGTPTLARGVFNKFYNTGGTDSGFSLSDNRSWAGTGIYPYIFNQAHCSSTGTMGGGNDLGYIPPAGGIIKAPIVRIERSDTNYRAQGKAYPIYNISGNGIIYSTTAYDAYIDMKGVSFGGCNGVIAGNVSSAQLTSCSMSRYYCQEIRGTHVLDNCIMSNPNRSTKLGVTGYAESLFYRGRVKFNDCVSYNSYAANSYIMSNTISSATLQEFISCIITGDTTTSSYTGRLMSPQNDSLYMDKCLCEGIIYNNSGAIKTTPSYIVKNSKFKYSSATTTNSYAFFMPAATNELTLENIEIIRSDSVFKPFLVAFYGALYPVRMRNFGSSRFPLTGISGFISTYVNSYMGGKTIDIARVYLDNSKNSSYSIYCVGDYGYIRDCSLGGGNAVLATTFNIQDFRVEKLETSNLGSYLIGLSGADFNGNGWMNIKNGSTSGMLAALLTNIDSGEGSPTGTLFNSKVRTLYDGGTIITECPFFAKGFSSFTGNVTKAMWTTTSLSGTGSNSLSKFSYQYDTSGPGGTGFNGEWIDASPSNLQSISIDPSIGVKMKLQVLATGFNYTSFDQIYLPTNLTSTTWNDNLITIDQTETTITLQNVVVGSRYWIYNIDSSSLITSGIASTSTIATSVSNLPDNTNIKIRVRYSSSTTKYLPYETITVTSGLSASVFISQIQDDIA